MKKVLIIIPILLLTGCTNVNKITKTIELSDNNCIIENETDTHHGFHNDGEYYAKLKCNNIDYNNLSNNYKKLPLNKEIEEALKVKQCDKESCRNIYEKYDIKSIKEGYYYFIDRHPESKDKYDPKDINNRASYNYTVALIDKENNIIYFYELDT